MTLYSVRYVHKIAPRDTDMGPNVELSDGSFSDSKRLAAALRREGVLFKGGRLREYRVAADEVCCFPVVPGLGSYWHAIVLRPIPAPLERGEAVEVLTWWAHGSDPEWFGGYTFDSVEAGTDNVFVRIEEGVTAGCVIRERSAHVRRAQKGKAKG